MFLPKVLPVPDLALGSLQSDLAQAERALGRLDAIGEILPNPDIFLMMYVRKEAVLSAQIEGTQASLDDVLNKEAGIPADRKDVEDVLNYIDALYRGIEALDESPGQRQIARGLICALHETMLRGTRGDGMHAGGYRKTQNWISRPGPPGPHPLDSAVYVPPPPDQVEPLMANLIEFVNARDELALLYRAGLAHAQFETIHPFVDGNGRLGRLLITLMLYARGALSRPLLYLSAYLKANRTEYYEALMRVRIDGEWEQWLRFFLNGVSGAASEGFETAKRVRSVLAEDAARIDQSLGRRAYARTVHDLLAKYPRVSAGFVSGRLQCAPATAISTLGDLARLGIVREVTGRDRDRVYVYQRYLDALTPADE
ncbi:MAG: Fic family protein [Phycisphaerales bacterium JB039]